MTVREKGRRAAEVVKKRHARSIHHTKPLDIADRSAGPASGQLLHVTPFPSPATASREEQGRIGGWIQLHGRVEVETLRGPRAAATRRQVDVGDGYAGSIA